MRIVRHSGLAPQLSVCVPVFDLSQSSVSELMVSVGAHTEVPHEIVIADCEGQALGYTKPQNAAVAAARSDVIVAANDDVTVHGPWLNPLLRELTAGAWCVTPDMTHTDGPQVFAPYFMMWPKRRWDEIGGLDERFVLWGSDIDLARRVVDAGHPPVKVRLSHTIQHSGSDTTQRHPHVRQQLERAAVEDLGRFQQKWSVSAEQEKGRLAQLVCFGVA